MKQTHFHVTLYEMLARETVQNHFLSITSAQLIGFWHIDHQNLCVDIGQCLEAKNTENWWNCLRNTWFFKTYSVTSKISGLFKNVGRVQRSEGLLCSMLSDPRPVVICYYFHYLPWNWVWLQFLCAVKIWGDLPQRCICHLGKQKRMRSTGTGKLQRQPRWEWGNPLAAQAAKPCLNLEWRKMTKRK